MTSRCTERHAGPSGTSQSNIPPSSVAAPFGVDGDSLQDFRQLDEIADTQAIIPHDGKSPETLLDDYGEEAEPDMALLENNFEPTEGDDILEQFI